MRVAEAKIKTLKSKDTFAKIDDKDLRGKGGTNNKTDNVDEHGVHSIDCTKMIGKFSKNRG